jgi:hypothetical protein
MRTISRFAGVALLAGGLFLGALGTWSDSVEAGGKGKGKGKGERHPHIHAAIKALQKARNELTTASHDFGGHRVAAIASLDNAANQLQTCLKYPKK